MKEGLPNLETRINCLVTTVLKNCFKNKDSPSKMPCDLSLFLLVLYSKTCSQCVLANKGIRVCNFDFPGFISGQSLLDCDFEDNFCKWGNDYNNWELNWQITSMRSVGMVDKDTLEDKGACIKSTDTGDEGRTMTSRMWGPPVSKKVKIGCVKFQYRLHDNTKGRLTLMRREMG